MATQRNPPVVRNHFAFTGLRRSRGTPLGPRTTAAIALGSTFMGRSHMSPSCCRDNRCLVIGTALLLCGLLLAVFAAAQAPAPAAAKPNPIVTIMMLDKTTVRGQLVSVEPDQLVVKKPGAAGETVTVRWSQIAKVSNGLTQEQAAAQWKALHKDELCADCHGDRGVRCNDCHGSGFDQAKLVDCKDCGGGGLLFCPNKKCDG